VSPADYAFIFSGLPAQLKKQSKKNNTAAADRPQTHTLKTLKIISLCNEIF
jgi:hypothetical protein